MWKCIQKNFKEEGRKHLNCWLEISLFLSVQKSCQNSKESGWRPMAIRKPKTRELRSNGVCPGEDANLHQPSICVHTSTEIRLGSIAIEKKKKGDIA